MKHWVHLQVALLTINNCCTYLFLIVEYLYSQQISWRPLLVVKCTHEVCAWYICSIWLHTTRHTVISWVVIMDTHLLRLRHNKRLISQCFCLYNWSHEKRSVRSLLCNFSAGCRGVYVRVASSHISTNVQHADDATPCSNSRTLIEYSVRTHTHTGAPETARWLLPWRLAVMCKAHVSTHSPW